LWLFDIHEHVHGGKILCIICSAKPGRELRRFAVLNLKLVVDGYY